MEEMGTHGNGTYDHLKKQWKIRTSELKASKTVKQLSKMFGEDLPADERLILRADWPAYRDVIAPESPKSVRKE